MSRWEFMRRLEELLSDISPSEREEALQYYNDYFNDAGKENEKQVIEALGTPEQVAEIVRDGLAEGGIGEFTETGYRAGGTEENHNAIVKTNGQAAGQSGNAGQAGNASQSGNAGQAYAQAGDTKDPLPSWAIVLLIIGGIIFSPVLIGCATGAVSLIFAVVITVICFIFSAAVLALALYIAAVCLWIAGFPALFVSPAAGIALIGAGLICAAIGIISMLFTVFLCGYALPEICKGVAKIWHRLFQKKGEKEA